MNKNTFSIPVTLTLIFMAGCGKKQQPLEEMQQPISMEELTRISTGEEPPSAAKPQTTVQAPPAKPTNEQVQTALKNAGFYAGAIDGKLGPQTKKAIEEFQKANNLKVDGKAGTKTWAGLSAYLNPAPAAPPKKQ